MHGLNFNKEIIIAGDYNQAIGHDEIQTFFRRIGVKDVFQTCHNCEWQYRDATYKRGTKCIDSIAVSDGLQAQIEGCKIIEWNKIIDTDHQGIMVDINIEQFFGREINDPDNIGYPALDSSRISHRKQFIELVEKRLDIIPIEQYIEEYQQLDNNSNNQLQKIDDMITTLFNYARKKIEGRKRGIPYSQEKLVR